MMTIIDSVTSFFSCVVLTSLKSTIVIALILIVQYVFRKRLSAKWIHALWLLLIARLVLKNLQGEVTSDAVRAAIDMGFLGYRGKMYE